LLETKSDNLTLRVLKAQWSEASAFKGVCSWLRLSTSHQVPIQAVCAQDDSMAMGARKAFEECRGQQGDWTKIPFLGCDGIPKAGLDWVRRNLLAATISIPANAGLAIEMIVKSINTGTMPLERTFTVAKPFPSCEVLAQQSGHASAASR
jgi:ribose transport system substrate-binding protein